jgi:hypothetical protein
LYNFDSCGQSCGYIPLRTRDSDGEERRRDKASFIVTKPDTTGAGAQGRDTAVESMDVPVSSLLCILSGELKKTQRH